MNRERWNLTELLSIEKRSKNEVERNAEENSIREFEMPFFTRLIVLIAISVLVCGRAHSICADGGPLIPLSADTSIFNSDPVEEAYEDAGEALDAIYGASGVNMSGPVNFSLTYNVKLWFLRVGGNVITGCLHKQAGETFEEAMVRHYLEEEAQIVGATPSSTQPATASGTASDYGGASYSYSISYTYVFYGVVHADGSSGVVGRLIDMSISLTQLGGSGPGDDQMY